MTESLDENFVQEMRSKLGKQVFEFELAKKRERHDAKIVSDEGRKKWLELQECVKSYIAEINEGFNEEVLSYSDKASPNEIGLRHEISGYDIRIAFDPASAAISYEGANDKGEFRPRVLGEVLEYRWDVNIPEQRRIRAIEFAGNENTVVEDRLPAPFPTKRMSEIILRRVVASKE